MATFCANVVPARRSRVPPTIVRAPLLASVPPSPFSAAASIASVPVPASCTVPPAFASVLAWMDRSPWLAIAPLSPLSNVSRTASVLASGPVATMRPPRLSKRSASRPTRAALSEAPRWSAWLTPRWTSPWAAIVPPAPCKVSARTVRPPIPACSIRPSSLASTPLPSVRLDALLAKVPPVLSNVPATLMADAAVPPWLSVPPRLLSDCASTCSAPATSSLPPSFAMRPTVRRASPATLSSPPALPRSPRVKVSSRKPR